VASSNDERGTSRRGFLATTCKALAASITVAGLMGAAQAEESKPGAGFLTELLGSSPQQKSPGYEFTRFIW